MRTLNVNAEIAGKMIRVGTISGTDADNARFQYNGEYRQNDGRPLSIRLPIQAEPYTPQQTRNFFEGLLPEGFTRRSVAQWMQVDERDYLSILHGLGRECLGAICITADGEETAASYERISTQLVRELAAEGASKASELVTSTHLSLAGASGKVGLYYDAAHKGWYLPKGTAPSTHIVKQSHIRLDSIITNEQLSLQTAARCGIRVPHSFIINTGQGGEHELLFATERYDRKLLQDAPQIDGLPRPSRLHQEDFSQAMGIPSALKYESSSGNGRYMKGMFDILRLHTADPIADQTRLWDMIVFNVLIGNTDAHVKNFSLLYSDDWRRIQLAPAYDIISTTVYEQSTRSMAFRIGSAGSIDEMRLKVFREAANEVGLGAGMAAGRVDRICDRFETALSESATALRDAGFAKAMEMKERILRTGGYRRML